MTDEFDDRKCWSALVPSEDMLSETTVEGSSQKCKQREYKQKRRWLITVKNAPNYRTINNVCIQRIVAESLGVQAIFDVRKTQGCSLLPRKKRSNAESFAPAQCLQATLNIDNAPAASRRNSFKTVPRVDGQ